MTISIAAGRSATVCPPIAWVLTISATRALRETARSTARVVVSAWFFMIISVGSWDVDHSDGPGP